jgi:uncharacterized membrane protein
MPARRRQLLTYLAIAVVVLFLLASLFNDRSSTSIDGILWWLAIFMFALLIVAVSVGFIQFLMARTRTRRPRRSRAR